MKKIYSILFITFIFSQSNTDISGNIDFYTAFKTSNEKLLKLPYRLANLKISHQNGDVQLIGDFSLEHQLKNTECGIYCLHFLVYMLQGKNFKKYANKKKTDKAMHKFRDKFYIQCGK